MSISKNRCGNRRFIGGSKESEHIWREVLDSIGTIVVFIALIALAIVFLAITGCSQKMNTIAVNMDEVSTISVKR